MPLGSLLYNPDTHRIKAQRDYDTSRDADINSDPWGDSAQMYLDFLLKALPNDPSKTDPAFEKLQGDLAEYGQKDPGIITPSGILINGNSRCAALRKNAAVQMRVAVLPSDWTWSDVTAVELELQMRKDYRRDYSFVNNLLALEEAVGEVGAEGAMKAFRMQKPSFNRSIWILQVLRDVVDRSQGTEAPPLNLRDFENDQGKLEELFRTYTAVSKTDPDAAELLKESRLLTLLLDKSKTDIRLVGDDFVPTFLEKHLADVPLEMEPVAGTTVPGLGRPLPAVAPELTQVKQLVTFVAKKRAEAAGTDEASRTAAEAELGKLDKAVESALDAAGKSARLKKSQQAAIDRINDAADDLDASVLEVADAKSKQALDEVALYEAVINLRQALTRFASSTARIVNLPPDGALWLQKLRETNDE